GRGRAFMQCFDCIAVVLHRRIQLQGLYRLQWITNQNRPVGSTILAETQEKAQSEKVGGQSRPAYARELFPP
ncbi:hypothetical protein, partial [Phormidium sp. CCY1219]|uniref:hypothetical protein n=1 Tax=Phormidium sp. CCY1219 TaxID=2886104 RepID=UPI002D1F4A92